MAMVRIYAETLAKTLVRHVLPIVAAVVLLVWLSFFIWKPFVWTTFSERLVWAGLAFAIAGGFLMFSQTSGGRDFGVPGNFMNSAHASVLHEWNIEIRKDIERLFGFKIRLFLIGLFTFLIGVIVQVLSK